MLLEWETAVSATVNNKTVVQTANDITHHRHGPPTSPATFPHTLISLLCFFPWSQPTTSCSLLFLVIANVQLVTWKLWQQQHFTYACASPILPRSDWHCGTSAVDSNTKSYNTTAYSRSAGLATPTTNHEKGGGVREGKILPFFSEKYIVGAHLREGTRGRSLFPYYEYANLWFPPRSYLK